MIDELWVFKRLLPVMLKESHTKRLNFINWKRVCVGRIRKRTYNTDELLKKAVKRPRIFMGFNLKRIYQM